MRKNNKPMGVSQWREYGKKYGYWKYFEDQINEKWEKKIITIPKGSTHPIHDKCEYCFELAKQEMENNVWKGANEWARKAWKLQWIKKIHWYDDQEIASSVASHILKVIKKT